MGDQDVFASYAESKLETDHDTPGHCGRRELGPLKSEQAMCGGPGYMCEHLFVCVSVGEYMYELT